MGVGASTSRCRKAPGSVHPLAVLPTHLHELAAPAFYPWRRAAVVGNSVDGDGTSSEEIVLERDQVGGDERVGQLHEASGVTNGAEHARRLAADTRLVEELEDVEFEGRLWEQTAEALAEYGYRVMRDWIGSGKIFEQCRAQGWNRGAFTQAENAGWHAVCRAEDLEDLVQETVAVAIVKFRDNILAQGRWDASQGASLTTYFIGQALIQFPDIFDRWWVQRRLHVLSQGDRRVDHPDFRTELELETMEHVLSLDRQLALILVAREVGYSYAEIAELVGLPSAHAVSQRMYRHRRDRHNYER